MSLAWQLGATLHSRGSARIAYLHVGLSGQTIYTPRSRNGSYYFSPVLLNCVCVCLSHLYLQLYFPTLLRYNWYITSCKFKVCCFENFVYCKMITTVTLVISPSRWVIQRTKWIFTEWMHDWTLVAIGSHCNPDWWADWTFDWSGTTETCLDFISWGI